MPSKSAAAVAERHPVLPDIGKKHMAKVDAQVQDIDWNVLIGQAIQRAVAIVGWSHKEAAAKVGVDAAEFGKWLSGTRRPQLDRLFAVDELRWPLMQRLAALDAGNELVTWIRRRSA